MDTTSTLSTTSTTIFPTKVVIGSEGSDVTTAQILAAVFGIFVGLLLVGLLIIFYFYRCKPGESF